MWNTIKYTKWYWWIPICSLFFIEEMVGWVWDARLDEYKRQRMAMFYRILIYHIVSIVFIMYYTLI